MMRRGIRSILPKVFKKKETLNSRAKNAVKNVTAEFLCKEMAKVLKFGKNYGRSNIDKGKKTLVEFISANPCETFHLGNVRNAFYGQSLANVLAFAGYEVDREYYVSDAKVSGQIQELGLTAQGKGDSYLTPYLKNLIKKQYLRLANIYSQTEAGYFLAQKVMEDLKKTIIQDFGIKFDFWVSEEALYKGGLVVKAYDLLKKQGLVYEKENAYWLDLQRFGQKNELLLCHDGRPTGFLSEIAYHYSKITRGYKKIINIWDINRQKHVLRTKTVMKLLGYKGEFEIFLCSVVNLKGGESLKPSEGVVFASKLIKKTGLPAAKFFCLQFPLSSEIIFDLAGGKPQKSSISCIQHAYMRVESLLNEIKAKKAAGRRETSDSPGIQLQSEIELMKETLRFPEIVEDAAQDGQIWQMCGYLQKLAVVSNGFCDEFPIVYDNARNRKSTRGLLRAVKAVFKNAFDIMGIPAMFKK